VSIRGLNCVFRLMSTKQLFWRYENQSEGTIIRVSCEGEVTAAGLRRAEASAESAATGSGPAKAGPRHNTNYHAQAKNACAKKSASSQPCGCCDSRRLGVYHRFAFRHYQVGGRGACSRQTLPVPVVEGWFRPRTCNLSRWSRHGTGVQHGHNSHARGRQLVKVAFTEGQECQYRRLAGAD